MDQQGQDRIPDRSIFQTRSTRKTYILIMTVAASVITGILLFGFEAGKRFTQVYELRSAHSEYNSNLSAKASRLISASGYGGFIHAFKNYVIRRDPEYKVTALSKMTEILDLIESIRSTTDDQDIHYDLDIISTTINEYRSNLLYADALIDSGAKIEIDTFVRVDDTAALKSLDSLIDQIEFSGAAIDMEASAALQNALDFLKYGLVLVFLTIAFTGLTIYFVRHQIQLQEALKVEGQRAISSEIAKSEFLASMSHEIRTPMTGVMGFADMLLEDGLKAESAEKVQKIKNLTTSLMTIINDILDASKLDAGKIDIERIVFSPLKVAEDVTNLFYHTCPVEKKSCLTITAKIADNYPAAVCADPTRLRQILINLMGNAVKFTDAGTVTMKCSHDPGRPALKFEVIDTGIGIDENAQALLFQDFVQADTSITRKYQGTGLGLSICRRLVELMGGEIGVESTVGSGSTFWFTLPYMPADAKDIVEDTTASTIGAPESSTRPLSVLLAEDNEINQTIIQSVVTQMGHTVAIANNGVEAIEQVKAGDFDLILMDVRMPEMSGPEAAQHIRQMPAPKSDIPIIAVTADVMPENKRSYLDAGIDDCVSKPIDRTELGNAIERIIAKAAAADTDATPTTDATMVDTSDSFDLDETIARLCLPREVVVKLLTKFAADYADADRQLTDHLTKDAVEDAALLAHSIKGVSASLGATAVSDAAATLEKKIKSGDTEGLAPDIHSLRAEIERVTTAIHGTNTAEIG